jgi:hypothetical protein
MAWRKIVWEERCVPRQVVRIQLTVKKQFENPQFWQSYVSCEIEWACTYTALVPQRQLWHLHLWVVSVQFVSDLLSSVLHTPSHGCDVANVGTNRHLKDERNCQCEFPCNSTSSTTRGTKGEEHVAVFAVYVLHDHSITTEPCFALRV